MYASLSRLAGPCNLVGLETAVVPGAGADMTNNYVTVAVARLNSLGPKYQRQNSLRQVR